jgi:hypothetical protein
VKEEGEYEEMVLTMLPIYLFISMERDLAKCFCSHGCEDQIWVCTVARGSLRFIVECCLASPTDFPTKDLAVQDNFVAHVLV